jgi:CheY-like chemotaxis protein
VKSEPGKGSLFYAVIPIRYEGPQERSFAAEATSAIDPAREPVLVVEDSREALFVYETYLKDTPYQMLPARTVREAREWLRVVRPAAIVLDILLEGESTWNFLAELKQAPLVRDIPIIVATMVANEARAKSLGADLFCLKPTERKWLLGSLNDLTRRHPRRTILVIDDDPVARYLLRTQLLETVYGVIDVGSGIEGLELARRRRPECIVLDLEMPDLDGFTVLDILAADPALRSVPVIVSTARRLGEADRRRLERAAAVLPKDFPSREAGRAALRTALVAAGLEDGHA